MSERFTSRRRIAAGVSMALASTALASGCSVFADKAPEPQPALERCFDKPLPEAKPDKRGAFTGISPEDYKNYVKDWYKDHNVNLGQIENMPIQLHYQESGKHITGIPSMTPDKMSKLRQGNVSVDNGAKHGSGFVAAPNIVVTSGHIAATEHLSDLSVTNDKGQVLKVVDGCIIYEDNGEFANPMSDRNKGKAADADMAVLRVEGSLNSKPLPIADAFPKRKTWATYVTNQGKSSGGNYSPKNPAKYSGLVMSKSPNVLGDIVMTGIDTQSTPYEAKVGSSGSIVADTETGKVIGISVGVVRNNDNTTFSPSQVASRYGLMIDAPFGYETGLNPVPSYVIGAGVIKQALTSHVYRAE